MSEPITLLNRDYDGENVVDAIRDLMEAFDERFTPDAVAIPKDEHGFHKGKFNVTVTWEHE